MLDHGHKSRRGGTRSYNETTGGGKSGSSLTEDAFLEKFELFEKSGIKTVVTKNCCVVGEVHQAPLNGGRGSSLCSVSEFSVGTDFNMRQVSNTVRTSIDSMRDCRGLKNSLRRASLSSDPLFLLDVKNRTTNGEKTSFGLFF